MPLPAQGVAVPALPVVEPVASPAPQPPAWWRRRWVLASGLAALFVLASGAAWWLSGRPEGSWLRAGTGQVSRVVATAANRVVAAAESGIQAVKERFAATPPPAPGPAVEAPRPASGRPASRRSTLLASKPVGGSDRTAREPAASMLAESRDPWQPAPLYPPPDPFLVIAEPVVENGPIYTAADTAVLPAELMRPRLPKSPPPGVRLEDLPRLEVLVSAMGEVESVRLMSPGATVQSAMMLSAVKTWHFQPAILDGRPVRYRLSIWLTR